MSNMSRGRKPPEDRKKPNAEQRVGAGKVRNAISGRDSMGRKMSDKDRSKLLRSGAEDIVAGNKKAAAPAKPKPIKSRGAGEVQRSKSGGAVRGPIPKAGGTNAADFNKGTGYTIEKQAAYAKRKADK